MEEKRKHETALLEFVEARIKEHGVIASLEPIDRISIRVNFRQQDQEEDWRDELFDSLVPYRDIGILAGFIIKLAAEYVEGEKYGFVTLAFNPTFSLQYHLLNQYWLGNNPEQGINFS